jgi:hypothetical protein
LYRACAKQRELTERIEELKKMKRKGCTTLQQVEDYKKREEQRIKGGYWHS